MLPLSDTTFSLSDSLNNHEVQWLVLLYRWVSEGAAKSGNLAPYKTNLQLMKGVLKSSLTPKPCILDHYVNCLWMDAASRAKSSWFLLKMIWGHSFSNFQKKRVSERTMIFFPHSGKFGFVQRMTELSSIWLMARVSVFVFLVTMTDLSWDIADLISQTSSLLETR